MVAGVVVLAVDTMKVVMYKIELVAWIVDLAIVVMITVLSKLLIG